MGERNDNDWQVGEPVAWKPVKRPERIVLEGRTVRVEPLNAAMHSASLFHAAHGPGADPHLWDYLAYGPFADEPSFREYLARNEQSDDPLFFAVVEPESGEARGIASLMRIDPVNGVGEIGHIWLGAGLQKTAAATEALFLLGDYLMHTLGYRRFEWKCDALNARSRRAAERLGFTYEGTFRQHIVYKGRNRDTAWYAILDHEWPAIRRAFIAWLDPDNFDDEGCQIRPLASYRTMAGSNAVS
jgi:RimJ/RimL family protein N-acetyltransferase